MLAACYCALNALVRVLVHFSDTSDIIFGEVPKKYFAPAAEKYTTARLSLDNIKKIFYHIKYESKSERIDNFEKLTKRTLEYYVELVCMNNVAFVCNIREDEEE